MAGRQSEGYGRSSIRGNQMNLGVPSAARLADGLTSIRWILRDIGFTALFCSQPAQPAGSSGTTTNEHPAIVMI
jgi:hypothetical protein